MRALKILFFSLCCVALTACPSKNRKEAKPSIVKKYVVMGDPAEVIKGASLKPDGAFEMLSAESSITLIAAVESIMGYDFDGKPKIHPHDIEAIQALYE